MFLFWATYFIVTYLSYFISEKLVKPFGFFDIKPFNCRKCLTTWALGISYLCISIIYFNWLFLLGGILVTIGTTIAIIYTEKEKQINN